MLRDVAERTRTPLTLQPLTNDEAKKLELHMVSYRERIEREYADTSMRTGLDVPEPGDLRRVKSDSIYVSKGATTTAFIM